MVQEKAFQIKIEPKLNRQSRSLLGSLGTATGLSAGIGGFAAGGLAGGVAGLLISQLKVFQPVISLVKGIVQMLSQFLQPITDVVILLLMPILQILKPILIVVRQIMQPFRQLAFSLSRQASQALREGDTGQAAGLFGLSIAAIGLGVEAVFAFFLKESIKGFIDAIGTLFTFIFPFLEDQINAGIKAAKDAIDFGVAALITTQAFAISKAATALGADVTKEFGNIIDTMNKLFIGDENSFKASFDSMTDAMQNDLQPKLDDALGSFLGSLGSFIDDIKAKAEAFSSSAGARSFAGAATRRARDNIFQSAVIRTLPLFI